MKKLLTNLIHAIKTLVMYSVHSHDYNKQHFTWTFSEALDWARCYPDDDFVMISTAGRMVAVRGN